MSTEGILKRNAAVSDRLALSPGVSGSDYYRQH